jgi:Tfp pilus assembly protein PilN
MVNLRQGEFALQQHDETVRAEFRRLGWLAGGVATAAGLAFLLNLYQLNTRYQSLRQEVRRSFVAALPETHTVVNEKIQLEDAVEALQKRQRLLRGTTSGSPLDVLRHLSAVIPEQIVLDLDEWTFDEESVRLQGTTTSFETTEALKTAIMSLGLFRDAQLKDVKTVAGSKKISFRLQLLFLKNEEQERHRPEKDRTQQADLQQPRLAVHRSDG